MRGVRERCSPGSSSSRPRRPSRSARLLGIGGPKRLTIAIVAATTVSVAGLSTGEEVGLGVIYVLVAGVLVWVPVAMYLVAGQRATGWLGDAQEWLRSNQRAITIYSLVILGSVLVAEALIELL